METRLVKRALIRAEGYPEGAPAPMYIQCGCGVKRDIIRPFDRNSFTYCECGLIYDGAGYIRENWWGEEPA